MSEMAEYLQSAVDEYKENLRAKVEALPEDAVLYRGNILDLIAGISDE